MIRLFVAIGMPPAQAARLLDLQDGVPGARWRPAASFHLTLRFAGDITERQADELDAELEAVRGAPFELTLRGAGAFDERGVLTAIWVGAAGGEPLAILQKRCEAAARRAGLPPEKRGFRPHVTLAYLAGAEPGRVGAWVQRNNLARLEPFIVDRFGLYSSWRSKEGFSYRLEREYSLIRDEPRILVPRSARRT